MFKPSVFFSYLVLLFIVSSTQAQIDPTFAPVVGKDISGAEKTILSNGKIIVWSGSLVVDGVANGQLAKLNSDGSLDTSFNYCNCHFGQVNRVIEAQDGKILVSGVNLAKQAAVVRLNSDGSVDNSYASNIAPVSGGTSGIAVWYLLEDGTAIAELETQLATPLIQ